MSVVAAAVVTSAVVGYSASQDATDAANAQTASGDRNQQRANELTQAQLDFAKEQWTSYQTNILPMEMEAQRLGISGQELALQRGQDDYKMYTDWFKPMTEQLNQMAIDGVEGQYDRVSREAANNVDVQFNREEDMQKRDMQRAGIDPRSGRYQAGENDMSARRATSRALATNTAVENERNRVEEVGFNRLATATGRTPVGSQPSQNASSPTMNSSGVTNAYSNAAGVATNAANMNNSNAQYYTGMAGNAMQGGISTGANLYSMYNNSRANSGVQQPNMFVGDNYTGSEYNSAGLEWGAPGMKDGGPVPAGIRRMPMYADSGVVNGPGGVDRVPAVIDGQQPAKLSRNEYVIPVDVVEAKGVEFFDKLLERYHAGPPPAHQQNKVGIRRH